MGNIKQINIKNRTYYCFYDTINIKDFDWSLLKIDKITQKYWYLQHWYITVKKIDDYKKINSVNPLYLMIGEVIGHIEGKNKSKYLVFNSLDENKVIKMKLKP